MGCNCKDRTKPLGPNKTVTPAATTRKMKSATPPPLGKKQSFTLETRDGKTQTFGSRLESEAARVRAGGGTIRTKP